MMDNSYDHWFSKYDQESFEKDFLKVPYYDFLNQLIVNPDFSLLPNEPQLSLDNVHKVLQQTIQKNHLIISTFILNLLDNSKEPFLRWVRSVIAYIDCEKVYSIMFWNLNFIPNFLEYRLYASFIRLYKFLISLNQNVIQAKSLNTEQIRLSNKFTIKTLAERYQDSLYVSFDELAKLQRQMLKVLKPLVSQNPTLIGKIYYFIYHMYDKPTMQLLKDLDQQFGQLENQWVKKILIENELAEKYIDAYLNDDKQGGDQFEFEDSEILKQLMSQNKQENLYKVDTQDKSLLEKSKKTQFLNNLDNKNKRRNHDGKSSVFVQNYSIVSDSTISSNDNRSKIYSEDVSNIKYNNNVQSNLTSEQYTFNQYSNNNLQNSVIGFLASDLIHLEKEHYQEFKNNKLQKRIQIDDSIKLNDDLVEFISKADNQISIIKDEDILIGDNYKRKKQRIKNTKNIEENESPDVHRKLYASFIRLYKFLISLNQNVIQAKSLNTEQIRLSNKFTIKTLAERYQDSLYVSFDELAKLQRQMLKVLKPLVSQNPTLIGKIYYFIYHMYDKPTMQLLKDLDQQFGQLENQWVKKILIENELAEKYIDAYLNDDKQGGDQFEFEDSEILKQLMSQNKQENLYKVDTQDKSLLEKSKKTQFLNNLDNKNKRRNHDGKSSVFVQNYSIVSDSTISSNDNRSKIYSEDVSNIKYNNNVQSNLTSEQYTFNQYSNNNLQNSVIGFLASDLIHLEKEHYQEFKNNKLQKRIQIDDSIKLNDDLVEFISKADNQISIIKDEDILIGDNYKRKKQRIKNTKNIEENESPDVHRKQTMINTKQQENHEDELRKVRARRLLGEQNQLFNEKHRYVNNQDNQLSTDKDIHRYSFEDSISEEDDESEDEIKLKQQQTKVIIPINQSQNTQGIIFDKFQQYSGLYIQGGSEKNKYFLNRLFHMNENSLRISGKSLAPDFEERKWEFLKQSILPQNVIKEENYVLNFDEKTKPIFDRQYKFKQKLKSNYEKYYYF
ncbi:unnamed protein product [Paramecium primaurelia]|uniref:Uncharacterized protein n=1 Tax=Paramecium primaurelia TaxID=5886 RepID=A0A8S1MZF6_PARPR|nr:unnamed protein product [Paramecium primaurelia]